MSNDLFRFMRRVSTDDMADFIDRITLTPNSFGVFRQQKTAVVNDFMTTDFDFIYMLCGKTRITTRFGEHVVSPGGSLLIEPYSLCSAQCMPEETVIYYYAHFDVSPSYLRDVYFRSVTGGGPPVFQPGELPDFRRELDALFQDQASGAFGFAAIMQSCLRILSVAMMRARYGAAEREQELSSAPSEFDLSILSHAIDLIDERLGEPVNVQGLCRELGVSYSFLYKLFVKMFNQPPTKYILQKKLSAAERLIRVQGATVAEAVETLGFSSPSHLSRLFKKHLGRAPTHPIRP